MSALGGLAIAPVVRPPVMGVCRDVLAGMRPNDMCEVALLARLDELEPAAEGLMVCRHNGEWVLTEDWPRVRAMPGDVIEWYDMPDDKDTLRSILMVVVLVIAIWNPLGWGALGVALFSAGANLAIGLLLPPSAATGGPQGRQAANVFSSSLQGNQAALDQPVWKTFGRRRITPPFAAQPYYEFIPKADPDDTGDTSDQYFYALFAVGEGHHVVERELIGDTQITNFADVQVHAYLPPGTMPSVVLANVTTAIEVANLNLESDRYVGGFAGCAPGRTVRAIGIDVIASRGLGIGESALTISWQVEVRPINDFGVAQGDWQVIANESRTASTNTPQRWSNKYPIAARFRPEVRLVRIDLKNTEPAALHEIAWVSLRAYLAQAAPLNPHVAHYEVVMRASDQLSSQTQNQFSIIVRGMVHAWHPVSGWSAPAESRNGAWHIVEIAMSRVMGLGYTDAQVDLPSFYACSLVAAARQDRCDYTFTSSTDAWSAMQLIARTLRARVFKRNGKLSIARDEWTSLPVTAFTPRNTQPDSMVLHEQLPTEQTFDGVILEYEDLRTWKWTPIEVPCPGVTTMLRPQRKRIEGVTGATHARREAVFEAASMIYRRTTVSCVTELQGLLPAYMDMVRWMPELRGYGQSGDVCFWDAGTLEMGLSEPVAYGPLPVYLTLIRDDGTCTAPVAVAAGATPYDVVLPSAPDFLLALDDGNRERPKYLLGPLVGCDEIVKVAVIADGGQSDDGARLIAIEGVVDDRRAHDADIGLLPGPGSVQDPIDTTASTNGGTGSVGGTGGSTGGGFALIVRLADHSIVANDTQGGAAVHLKASFTLHNNGSASWTTVMGAAGGGPVPSSGGYANEWLSQLVEVADAAEFEVRAILLPPAAFSVPGTGLILSSNACVPASYVTGTLNAFEGLGATRTWSIGAANPLGANVAAARLQLAVRRVSTGVVLATRTIILVVLSSAGSGSGGGGGDGPSSGGGGDGPSSGGGGDGPS